ncbi:SpoIID/LytB domain-containing protein [Anaerosacchariphilus polymeriproducens]|uniref:SpoIID/LytB domain-containing protein n=1 Tax=Anaerosacchariphilus polymeriproducens TaxID=1812858 RepID=A0A371ATW6_9FIRM|nr:SpoIID/LytB domain-containing protein [Anaerosacchariphilus polymeriproducens]RDU22989.1 SpoIID/LytB domain-containing protein [Anaerosacchariphilus polymeriproducens]
MKKKGFNQIVLIGFLFCIAISVFIGVKYLLEEKRQERFRISKEEMIHYLSIAYDSEKDCRNLFEKNLGNQIKWSDVGFILKSLDLTENIEISSTNLNSNDKILKEDWIPIYFEIIKKLKLEKAIRKEQIIVLHNDNKENKCTLLTDKGLYTYWDVNYFKQYGVYEVVVKGNEIVGGISDIKKESKLSNVWLASEEKGISIWLKDKKIKLNDITVKDQETNGICDLYIQNMKVKKIVKKKDVIKGKLLSFDDKQIEVEGYGTIPSEKDFRLYQIYDGIIEKEKNEMVIGDNWIEFVVADKKICAGLITQPLNMETIRVLLLNDNKEAFHDEIEISSAEPFYVIAGDKNIKYEGNEVFKIDKDTKLLDSSYLRIESGTNNGKIMVKSISRSLGEPSYEGTLEIRKKDDKLIIVNELAMENYLYGVLPSEMPSSFGKEALKVQAICARSFAYCQILNNDYAAYGAHVDDSTNYQVYNNLPTNEESIQAVDETKGLVATYNGEVVETYYFSCSSGHTTDFTTWGEEEDAAHGYLKGTYVGENIKNKEPDLSSEENFKKFIKDNGKEWFDQSGNWFRWKCKILNKDIIKRVNAKILKRYDINPKQITAQKDNEEIPIKQIKKSKEIRKIEVSKRDENGNVLELTIVEDNAKIKIKSEYNIRAILGSVIKKAENKDEDEVEINGLLPSAFFYIEPQYDENKNIESWNFAGGGHGHGIGLSQTACKAMDSKGMTFKEILNYFYNNIEIKDMYKE